MSSDLDKKVIADTTCEKDGVRWMAKCRGGSFAGFREDGPTEGLLKDLREQRNGVNSAEAEA